jgi:uncharacterized protein (TIGR01777 family)
MKVIITGATGFIGKALTRRLVEKGYEVVVLSRSIAKVKETFADLNITIAQWDGRTSQGWANHADGAYAIINLAGESVMGYWTQKKKQAIFQSRFDAIHAVIDAVVAAAVKPQVIIHGSAICYPPDTAAPCDESSECGDGFLATGTQQLEDAASEIAELDCRLVLVRTGFVLGNGGGALEPMVKSFKYFLGGHFGKGGQWLPWISLDDEVGAIIYLMENKNASGIFNLTAPRPLIMKDFCLILAKVLRRPCLFSIPPFIARITVGQMADELLLSGQNVIPKRLLEAGYKFRHTDIEPTLTEILHNP